MRDILPLLPRPSRYIGIEEGSVVKQPDQISLRLGLAFPDLYEVGMSYLGQKILYSLVNQRPTWWAERVFAPCKDSGAIMREQGARLCTLESHYPLHKLDVVGFSITHELCYTNVLWMLDLAGIPLRAADRAKAMAQGQQLPLIIAGGGCTLAAEPLAPFMDLMVLGDGEEVLVELLTLLEQAKSEAWTRSQTLQGAAKIPGIYVPEFFVKEPDGTDAKLKAQHGPDSIVRRLVPDMNSVDYPAQQTMPFGAVHNRLALEIARGCTRGCRFCQAGMVYRPVRERTVDNLSNILGKCLAGTGYDDVSFLSLSTGDFSALKGLFLKTHASCAQEQISISLPSLRVGSIDDSIMEKLSSIRRTGVTLAPEAGSQRLRDVINKGVTEEELITHVQKLFEYGWQQVKLYFMIGLPTETHEDIKAIVELCRKVRDAAGPGIKRLQVTAAISPFVPKPHTPFQWERQLNLAEIRERIGWLLTAFKGEKRLKMRWHEPETSFLEGVFSRGDRSLAPVIETAYAKGAIFASWMEHFRLQPWLDAMQEHGINPDDFLAERAVDSPLPWSHLNTGLNTEFLLRERKKAVEGKISPDCRYGACQVCGVCDLPNKPSQLADLTYAPEARPEYKNRLNLQARDQEAHKPRLDEWGRVIERYIPPGTSEAEAGEVAVSTDSQVTAHSVDTPATPDATDLADNKAEKSADAGKDDRKKGGKPAKKGGKTKPPAIDAALALKAANYRIIYSKQEGAVYLSQLELQSLLDQAMRRAGLALSFSQGFHPLPHVTFGRALPVGVASLCEYFGIHLRERLEAKDIYERLNAHLPRGLQIVEVEELPVKTRLEQSQSESYTLSYIGPESGRADFVQAWKTFQAKTEQLWTRETKKGPRTQDIRPLFKEIRENPDSSLSLLFDWSTVYISPLGLSLEISGFSNPAWVSLLKIGSF